MYKKFEALSDEKRMRIINSSFKEFANKQFKEASTDEIAKSAEISKGALFQYFGTKKQLYLYAFNYAYEVFAKDFWGEVDLTNPDIFERIKGVSAIKMKLYCKYPSIFEFMLNSYRETDKDITLIIKKELDVQKQSAYSKMYANIDYSKFKEDFNSSHILSIVGWSMEGFANSEVAKLKPNEINVDKYEYWLKELDQYILTFKKAFYKEGN